MFSSLLQQTKPCFVVIEFYLGYRIFSLKNPRGKLCPHFGPGEIQVGHGKKKKKDGSMKQPENRAQGVGICVLGESHSWVRQSCGLTAQSW